MLGLDFGKFRTDGTIMYTNHALCNFEFKNEMGCAAGDPNEQNIAYFIKLTEGKEGAMPMFLVSVVGCYYLQVFGALWHEGFVCVDPLCPPLSLLFVQHDNTRSKEKLACILKALYDGTIALQTISISMEAPPWFSGEALTFVHVIKNKPKIFLAYDENRKQNVIVKFVGQEVHHYLAGVSLAPILYQCIDIVAGWKYVMMEAIEGAPLNEAKSYNKRKFGAFLEVVRLKLQATEYVHGDIRSVNILATRNSEFKIIDFDWAGKEGIATYPATLNTEIPWHPDASPCNLIMKSHDEYEIDQLCNDYAYNNIHKV